VRRFPEWLGVHPVLGPVAPALAITCRQASSAVT